MSKIILCFLLSPFALFAQNLKFDEPNVNWIRRIDEIDTVVNSPYNKNQLYSNAIAFLSKTFPNAKVAIEVQDLETGEMFIKGSSSFSYVDTLQAPVKKGKMQTQIIQRYSYLNFKCRMYFKDGKFKIVMSNMQIPVYEGSGVLVQVADIRTPAPSKAKSVALDFLRYMSDKINQKPENAF